MKGIVTYVGAKQLSYDDFLASESAKKKKKYTKRTEKVKEEESEQKIDFASEFASAKFFIPEDKKEAAERAFAKNNGSFTKTVLSCFFLIAFMMIIVLIMPAILKGLHSLI